MKTTMKCLILVLASVVCSKKLTAQEMVVVMDQDYAPQELLEYGEDYALDVKKGQVIKVYKNEDGEYEYYGPYTATFLMIPSSMFHVLGDLKGEKYLLVKSSNMLLREGPSNDSGIYSYDANSGSSYAKLEFVQTLGPVVEEGYTMDWKPYTFPKGCRLPYLGTEKGFYKTQVNGQEFYVSKKYCKLK